MSSNLALNETRSSKAGLLLKQSIFTGALYFLIFTAVPSFFLEYLLCKLGISLNIASTVKDMVVWTLPALTVRILAENFKTFLRNQGHIKLVGNLSVLCFLPFIPVCYFVLIRKNMGCLGIGICMLQYELLNLLAILVQYCKLAPEERSSNWKTGLRKYLQLALRQTLKDWHTYIIWEILTFIVGMTGSLTQLTAFNLQYCILLVLFSLSYGLNLYTRTHIEEALQEGNYDKSRRVVKNLFV